MRYATNKDAQLLSEYIMSVTFVFILNHVHQFSKKWDFEMYHK